MNIPGHSSDQFYGAMYEALPDMGELEASDDGLHYKKVCKLKPVYQGVSTKCRQHTVTFPEVKSRFSGFICMIGQIVRIDIRNY